MDSLLWKGFILVIDTDVSHSDFVVLSYESRMKAKEAKFLEVRKLVCSGKVYNRDALAT
jgi:hypothetical protein